MININQFEWNGNVIAGHDDLSNPVTVAELVAAIDGLQFAKNAACSTIRDKDAQIAELEAGLNHALARLNSLNAA